MQFPKLTLLLKNLGAREVGSIIKISLRYCIIKEILYLIVNILKVPMFGGLGMRASLKTSCFLHQLKLVSYNITFSDNDQHTWKVYTRVDQVVLCFILYYIIISPAVLCNHYKCNLLIYSVIAFIKVMRCVLNFFFFILLIGMIILPKKTYT